MSHIDNVKKNVAKFFHHDTEKEGTGEKPAGNYVRILDTPNIWGEPFGTEIMPKAKERTKDFERAILEIVEKTLYRCDVASLNSPDPDWARVILKAMDVALTLKTDKKTPTQFRLLFGETPMSIKDGTHPSFIYFQGALLRLVR